MKKTLTNRITQRPRTAGPIAGTSGSPQARKDPEVGVSSRPVDLDLVSVRSGPDVGALAEFSRPDEECSPRSTEAMSRPSGHVSNTEGPSPPPRNHADKLAQEARNLWTVFDNLPDLVVIVGVACGKILAANRAAQRFGYIDAHALVGKSYSALIPDKPRKSREETLEGIRYFGGVFEAQELLAHDGSTILVDVTACPITWNGSEALMATFRDVTDRERVRKALEALEHRYRTVADFTHDWEYWISPSGALLYVSPSCERITGYCAEELIADPDLLRKIVHPEDAAEMDQHFQEEAGLLERTANPVDFRIIHRSGETRWIGHVCQVVRGSDGRILGRRASNRDITQQKTAELQVAASREMIAALLNAAVDLAFFLDTDGIILALNQPCADRLGGSISELVGNNIFDLFPPQVAAQRRLSFEKVIQTRGSVELVDQRDGRTFHSHLSPVCEDSGAVAGVAVFARDVTQRMQVEEALKESEERYRAIFEDAPVAIWEEDISEVWKILKGLRDHGVRNVVAHLKEHFELLREAAARIRIVNANRAAVALFGAQDKRELLGPLGRVLPWGTFQTLQEQLVAIAEGRSFFQTETTGKTLAGRQLNCLVSLSIPRDTSKNTHLLVCSMDITEIKRLEKELQYLAEFDPLTGLLSRRRFIEKLEAVSETSNRYGVPLSLCLCDLDRFKDVNDTYGHLKGDEVLAKFGELLRAELRRSDFAARYGGDEFILAFPHTESGGAAECMERIRTRLARHTFHAGATPFRMTFSGGVTECIAGTMSVDELVLQADQALYQGKHQGRDRVLIHETWGQVLK